MIKVVLSGLPGNMAMNVAKMVEASEEFELANIALTGEETLEDEVLVLNKRVKLIKPSKREGCVENLKGAVIVDYSTPDSYISNCKFFVKYNLPFVIGTTGAKKEDMDSLESMINESSISAVIDQNMSIELVLISSALQYLADRFPGTLTNHAGYGFESHQAGKKDRVSGTLLKWGSLIKKLGVNFYMAEGDRTSNYGHAYHTLNIMNEQGNVRINIRTEVEGRQTYAQGTLRAVKYLANKLHTEKGKVYSMTDVLSNR